MYLLFDVQVLVCISRMLVVLRLMLRELLLILLVVKFLLWFCLVLFKLWGSILFTWCVMLCISLLYLSLLVFMLMLFAVRIVGCSMLARRIILWIFFTCSLVPLCATHNCKSIVLSSMNLAEHVLLSSFQEITAVAVYVV